jgi:hypothetical protein
MNPMMSVARRRIDCAAQWFKLAPRCRSEVSISSLWHTALSKQQALARARPVGLEALPKKALPKKALPKKALAESLSADSP